MTNVTEAVHDVVPMDIAPEASQGCVGPSPV